MTQFCFMKRYSRMLFKLKSHFSRIILGPFYDRCGKVRLSSDCDWCYLPLISPAVSMTWGFFCFFFLILFHIIQFVYYSSSFSFVIRTNIHFFLYLFVCLFVFVRRIYPFVCHHKFMKLWQTFPYWVTKDGKPKRRKRGEKHYSCYTTTVRVMLLFQGTYHLLQAGPGTPNSCGGSEFF